MLGIPAVVLGHNDRIAWGVTNLAADVQDLYIEKINPDNPDQYEVNGQWVDMDVYTETLIAGGKKIDVQVRATRKRLVISDSYGPLEDFDETAAVAGAHDYAIALKWTALEPTRMGGGHPRDQHGRQLGRVSPPPADWNVPAQNLTYADVDGNIGYQTPGRIPIRADGDGRLPVPGWTNQYEWTGFIPFEDLPNRFNPPEGFIVTANNAVVHGSYPYLLARDWAYGTRAQRITDLIEQSEGPMQCVDDRDMQR